MDNGKQIQCGLVLRQFVLRRFTFTTLVESDRALTVATQASFLYISALLALFWCACVSSFSILVQFFYVDCDFSTYDVHKKDRLSSFAKRSEKNKEDCNFTD